MGGQPVTVEPPPAPAMRVAEADPAAALAPTVRPVVTAEFAAAPADGSSAVAPEAMRLSAEPLTFTEAGAPEAEAGEAEAAREEDAAAAGTRGVPGGPNLMLAIVCWIASATAFFESFALYRAHWLRSYAFTGYFSLGLGILLFSFEALSWGKRKRGWMAWVYLPAAALTILGIVSLVLSQAPGRRI